MIFLLQYDRNKGALVRLVSFTSDKMEEASKARLNLEIELMRTRTKHEVVLLEAESQNALKHTHSRYFQGVTEMINFDERKLPAQQKKK